jgi:hypothetical protein
MCYAIPDRLPWDVFAAAWERAEEALARLDQTLAVSDLKEAWTGRAHFAEAAATLWLDGEAVGLEELVLHDAATAPTPPTRALFIARSVLRARRHLARRSPAEVLSVDAILDLHEHRRRQEIIDNSPVAAADPDRNPETRIAEWLRVLERLGALPVLPAAALALHAWQRIDPVPHGGAILGRLLIPVYLRARNKTRHHDLCLGVGLRRTWSRLRPGASLGEWVAGFLEALAVAADHGLEAHRRLVLANAVLAQPLAGRRRSSHLGALRDLLLHYPLVSAPMAAKRLGLSPRGASGLIAELVRSGAVRELTGRSRYRAFAIL